MSAHSLEDFRYLEISRPVTGATDFLNKVRHHSDKILGTDFPTVVTQPGNLYELQPEREMDDGLGPDILIMTGIPQSRTHVYDEKRLKITLLERRVPKDLNPSGNFSWVAGRLIANGERIHNPIKKDGVLIPPEERHEPVFRTSGLYAMLDRAGLEFDIMPSEQAALPIELTGIEINNDSSIDTDGLELALTISPVDNATRMLVKQSRMCFRGLASFSKRAAYPTHPNPLNVPFIRIPNIAGLEESKQFVKAIEELLPVRFIMGAVDTYMHH